MRLTSLGYVLRASDQRARASVARAGDLRFTWQRPSSSKMTSMRVRSLFLLQNSALASSTLLVKCSSNTCKVSVIAFFLMISAGLLISAPLHTSDQEAADKQAWSLLPARASVLHARSLLASNQECHLHTCVCPLKWEGGKSACTLVAGTQDVPLEN